MSAYTAVIATTQPEAAVAWAESIADEDLRTSRLTQAVGVWLGRDPQSARAWLERSPLPADVKARLLRHGNFDYATGSTQWDPKISDRHLPASLYHTSKPAFFGNAPWPPIGPDRSPMVSKIPAQLRYAGEVGDSGLGAPQNLRVVR